MTQSPDERGIDVALLYQRNLFKLLSYQSFPVEKPRKNSRPTRDILHVSGLLLNRDTLDVLVAHFPSRSGGARESEPYRLLAARKVKHAIDSLYTIRRHPQIVLLGDFNDYPENKSIKEVLEAAAPSTLQDSLRPQKLYHLLAANCTGRRPTWQGVMPFPSTRHGTSTQASEGRLSIRPVFRTLPPIL